MSSKYKLKYYLLSPKKVGTDGVELELVGASACLGRPSGLAPGALTFLAGTATGCLTGRRRFFAIVRYNTFG